MECIEEEQKYKSLTYNGSIVCLCTLTVLILCISTTTLQKMTDCSFSLIGIWIDFIGVSVFSWTWANPKTLNAWDGNGIDNHPEDVKSVLLPEECKKHSIWKQPNRLKLIVATIIVSSGLLIQALDQTNDHYQRKRNQSKLIDLEAPQ